MSDILSRIEKLRIHAMRYDFKPKYLFIGKKEEGELIESLSFFLYGIKPDIISGGELRGMRVVKTDMDSFLHIGMGEEL